MPLDNHRRIVRVFLASPGDLRAERRRVRALIEELNQGVAPELGLYVDMYGWESQAPGAGRPQAIINERVDTCDLFIGLLGEWWGSDTGEDTSGFHEEYRRALDRRNHGDEPELMLLMKEIEPARVRDPGPQLQRVLAFRQQLIADRVALYQEFRSRTDLEKKLRLWVQQHLFAVAERDEGSAERAGAGSQPALSSGATAGLLAAATDPPEHAPTVLVAAVRGVLDTLGQPTREEYVNHNLRRSELEMRRLHLHVAAWAWAAYGGEILGHHDHNRLYQLREGVELLVPEVAFLVEMLVGDAAGYRPGWYWASEWDFKDVVNAIWRVANAGRDADVRARGIDLLTATNLAPSDDAVPSDDAWIAGLLADAEGDATGVVARAVIRYVASKGDREQLARLAIAPGFTAQPVREERLRAELDAHLAAGEPARAAEAAVAAAAEAPTVVAAFIDKNPDVFTTAVLASLRGEAPADVVEAATRAAFARGVVGEGELRARLAAGGSRATRAAAIRALIARGATLSPEEIRKAFPDKGAMGLLQITSDPVDIDALVLEFYRQMPADFLETQIDYFSTNGPLAYRALGLEHFETAADRIRTYALGAFEALRPSWVVLVDEDNPGFPRLSRSLDWFIRMQFLIAALEVLAERGDARDADIAREFLRAGERNQLAPAARLLARLGTAADASLLAEAAERTYGDHAAAAVEAALTLSPGLDGIADRLLSSSTSSLVLAALRSLTGSVEHGESSERLLARIEPLLLHEREEIRVGATALLSAELDRDTLEEVMRRYRQGERYFYDVGCWLDRVLYAPGELGATYCRQLYARLAPSS